MTKQTIAITVMLVSCLPACNRRTGDLASYARGTCVMFAGDLESMAKNYGTRLGVADKDLSKDQLDATDARLGNLGLEARGVMSLALQRQFGFCMMIRADKARAEKLEEQFQRDLQTYRESPDLAQRSKSVDDMAAKARELTQLALEGQPD